MNALIGKTLTGIEVSEDRYRMICNTPDGEIVGETFADCCSDTWIEHVELPAGGFPAIVSAVEQIEMPEQALSEFRGATADQECRQFYGTKITTDKGEIIIDYRNDSNGYYGGSLDWPEEDNYADS